MVSVRLQGRQRALYMAAAAKRKAALEKNGEPRDGTETIRILAELTRLRQLCCDPALCDERYRGGSAKLETCMELVRSGVSAGHKILLFSQFTSMLRIIGQRLRQEAIACWTLTGSTPGEDRRRMTDAFGVDPVPVFLISLRAGGTGLNLTAADMVIHYDPWWNAAAQEQATDRAHRIGQKKQVSVFKLIAKEPSRKTSWPFSRQRRSWPGRSSRRGRRCCPRSPEKS